MARGRVLVVTLFSLLLGVSVVPEARGVGTSSFQPDGWIKLCGINIGCTIDPLPHPWLGKDIYNTTGRKQAISVRLDNGRGVRFWITVENDGTQADTVAVIGCPGNRNFIVNRVLLGKHKDQDPNAKDLTRKYKQGTLSFALASGQKQVFTLNILTYKGVGETYRCITTLQSVGDAGAEDAVVATLTIY